MSNGVAVLQSGSVGSAVAVAGTFASFALFLSVTAFLAARNVLGEVSARKSLVVGSVPAAVAVVFTTYGLPSLAGVALALLLDAATVKALYGRSNGLTAYVTFVHFVVSVILGAVLFAGLMLLSTAPS
ncbi:DUF7473 family protein [Halopelagius longus]|uniref:Uncharacterized protein n=1 Tax=Halopelagius longus TaxID=1236180 RepID=A0A1H1EDQ4_9EURY|nr:hypothetical protein [Halopelagius longus]RDI73058.1 hypothetical protein DWB78_08190 [Halopelagius longus]SDQ86668.1 hypothetical protein SAMN05216278_2849 [Halopelagius longus]